MSNPNKNSPKNKLKGTDKNQDSDNDNMQENRASVLKPILSRSSFQPNLSHSLKKEANRKNQAQHQNLTPNASCRRDSFGIPIIAGGPRKHKISFSESTQITEVQSYKKYNTMQESSCCCI